MDDTEAIGKTKPPLSREQFLQWRSPRIGSANPTPMDNPLWSWLVHTRLNAWQANQLWDGPNACEAGPMWCFDRFGQSRTELPDGRTLYIAGEHEDHYDPDFFIYNDVVLVAPSGEVTVYGYPHEAFPATDFHSATLAGDRVIIVGNLGYPAERVPGTTPVLELSLRDFSVRKLVTQGDAPGWIHRHSAALSERGDALVISGGRLYAGPDADLRENIDQWTLDLASATWTRSTDLRWPQWSLVRADRKRNLLWEMRQAAWARSVRWEADAAQWLERVAAETGQEPELALLDSLYRPDDSVSELPRSEDEYNIVRVSVDGVPVKITEDAFTVRVLVQGLLPADRLKALQDWVLGQLARLHGGAPWTVLP